jgi:mRNA interferase RelE/StbE
MSYEVIYELPFLDLAAGFMKDDSSGVAALFDTVDQLADDPRPGTSFIRGEYARLRAGRYRVKYQIDEEAKTVKVQDLARLP